MNSAEQFYDIVKNMDPEKGYVRWGFPDGKVMVLEDDNYRFTAYFWIVEGSPLRYTIKNKKKWFSKQRLSWDEVYDIMDKQIGFHSYFGEFCPMVKEKFDEIRNAKLKPKKEKAVKATMDKLKGVL